MPEPRQSSFGAGEFSPSLWGADHLHEYAEGARTLRNFLVSKYRTAVNRPGTIFCHEVKDSTRLTRLLPFTFSSGQAYALEAGDKNFRITKADGTAVAAAGLIAAGNAGVCARSADKGATWAAAAALPYAGDVESTCEVAAGRIVLGTYDGATSGAIAYTDDHGLTWAGMLVAVGNQPVYSVAFNGRRLLAASLSAIVYSDDNGATWTPVAAPPALTILGLAWGNGRWIAVGYTGATQSRYSLSYDGLTWTAAATIGDLDGTHAVSALNSVMFCAGQFVAVGYVDLGAGNLRSLMCQFGVASANWKWGTAGAANEQLRDVATDGTTAIAVGHTAAAAIAYKFDSVAGTWAAIGGVPAGNQFIGVTYSRGYYIAVGVSRCSRYDGTAWTANPAIPAGTYRVIAPGKGTEVLEVTTPYESQHVRDLATTQSGDIQTLFHLFFAPRELRRYGEHDWRLDDWYKVPPTRIVGGLAFTPSANQTADQTHVLTAWEVVVTWEDEETGRESLPSAALVGPGTGTFLVYPDKPQSYQWNVVEKARRYHVYRGLNGEWGWIGSVKQPTVAAGSSPTTVTWQDKGQVPVWSENPPSWTNPFQSDLSYPACGCYLDDRLVVGGSMVQPAVVKGSKVSDYWNFDEPLLATEASPWEFNLATRRFEEIVWAVPLEVLALGTSEAEWVIGGGDSGIDATNVLARAKSHRACARVQPCVVGNGVVYVQTGGQVVRLFRPTGDSADPVVQAGGFELSLLSAHLLEGRKIVDLAYAASPDSVIWIVCDDGALLSVTLIPEHKVWAFARHDSGGDKFEAVTCIPDGTRDVPFFVVARTIGGATKRYVERLASRTPVSASVAVFFDSAKSYTIAAGNTVTGLSHLEGRTVGVLADGTSRGTYVVAAGAVTFTGAAATTVVVGLPIEADFGSLDFPQGRTKHKKVARVGLEYRLNPATADPAAGVKFGQDETHLSDVRKLSDARDGVLEVPVDSGYNPGGRCFLRHSMPFAIEIRGVTRKVEGA